MGNKYIVKEGMALSTLKGIVASPKDPKDVKQSEIITAKDIKTGQKGLDMLLAKKNCPIKEFKGKVKKSEEAKPVKGAEKKDES